MSIGSFVCTKVYLCQDALCQDERLRQFAGSLKAANNLQFIAYLFVGKLPVKRKQKTIFVNVKN